MTVYNLPNTEPAAGGDDLFQFHYDTANDTANLGSNSSAGIVLGTGDDTFYLGAGGQTAIGGIAPTGIPAAVSGNDTFVIGTDGSAAENVVLGSAESELAYSDIEGGSGVNTLKIVGGTTNSLHQEDDVWLSSAYELDNISKVQIVDTASTSTVLHADNGMNYAITASGGTGDYIDLTNSGALSSVTTSGTGGESVQMGATGQVINLGGTGNTVTTGNLGVTYFDYYTDTFYPGFDLSHTKISGGVNGSTATSVLNLNEHFVDDYYDLGQAVTPKVQAGPGQFAFVLANDTNEGQTFGDRGIYYDSGELTVDNFAQMSNGIVGFKTLNLGESVYIYDGGYSSAAYFGFGEVSTNITDMAGATNGLSVNGTAQGGDTVVLNQTNQDYIGNVGYDPFNNSYANNVVLNAGAFNAGVTLNGGVNNDNFLILMKAGTYNFNNAHISNFSTVFLEGNSQAVTLDTHGTATPAGGYNVEVEASYIAQGLPSGAQVTDSVMGATGSNTIEFNGYFEGDASAPPVVFSSASTFDGGAVGVSNVMIIDEASNIDLSQATVANFEEISLTYGSTLHLTVDQIGLLDAEIVNHDPIAGEDPRTLFVGNSDSTLVVDMSADHTNLNVSSLNLASFELTDGGTVAIDDSLTQAVTIEGDSGTEVYSLQAGSGKAHVNAGSGDDTIITYEGAASNSVLIAGNGGNADKFQFVATTSATENADHSFTGSLATADTIVAPSSGTLTIEASNGLNNGGGVVDFTNATFQNFGTNATILVDGGVTAKLTLAQFTSLTSNGVQFTGDGTLDVTAAADPTFTETSLGGFSGELIVNENLAQPAAPGFNPSSITVDVSALTQATLIEGNSNFFASYYTIDGGSSTTVLFDNAGGATVTNDDTLHGNGGNYTLEVMTNTNFAADLAHQAMFLDNASSVWMQIAGGANATVDSTQLTSKPILNVESEGGPSNLAQFTVNVTDDTLGFSQSQVLIYPNGQYDPANPYNIKEVVNVLGSSAATVDLRGPNDTGDVGYGNQDMFLTVVDDNAAGDKVYAGLGVETLNGNSGDDTFIFDDPNAAKDYGAQPYVPVASAGEYIPGSPATTTPGTGLGPNALDDTLNGGNGLNLLQVGGGAPDDYVVYDFRGSALNTMQTVLVDNYATGIFNSTQLDGDSISVNSNADLVVHVVEGSNLFSLVTNPISHSGVNANFDLTYNSGTITLYDEMGNGNTLFAGPGTETVFDGVNSETIYGGGGTTTIHVRDGGGSTALANLYGGGTGSTAVFDFDYNGNSVTSARISFKVSGQFGITPTMPSTFYKELGTVNGNGSSATINIDANTDMRFASISKVQNLDVTGGDAVALAYGQVVNNYAKAPVMNLNADSTSAGLLIVAPATSSNGLIFSTTGSTAAASTYIDKWSGTLTLLDSGSGHSTIDARGLHGGKFSTPTGFDGLYGGANGGVAIYGAAGDTIYTDGNNGDYVQGGGASTTIVVTGGIDGEYLAGGGCNNTVEFASSATTAAGDIIHGGGGKNETLQIDGTTDFRNMYLGPSNTASVDGLNSIDHILFNTKNGGATYAAEFSYAQIVHDLVTVEEICSTNLLYVADNGSSTGVSSNAIVTLEIDGGGVNMDLRQLNTSNFLANIPNGGVSQVLLDDLGGGTNSVTVYTNANGPNTDYLNEAGDTVQVNGHGDTVYLGTGADIVSFAGLNVANNVHIAASTVAVSNTSAALNNATFSTTVGGAPNVGDASNLTALGAMGDLVQGLANAGTDNGSASTIKNYGYVDLQGYTLTAGASEGVVNTTPIVATSQTSTTSLNSLFSQYGVIEDGDVQQGGTTGHKFLDNTLSHITGAGVAAGAADIENHFTYTGTEQGFVTVADAAGDVALYYVNTAGGAGGHVAANQIHLVGVFENLISGTINDTGAGTNPAAINQAFFHVHA